MTYEESASLMTDFVFRGRIKVAALKFATSILNENPGSVEGHPARYRWAQQAAMNPDQESTRLQPMVVMDPQVQLDGPGINDAALQGTVEAVANKFI